MLRRAFWAAAGAGFGVAASMWVRRAVRDTVDRYRPGRVSTDVAGALGHLGRDLRAAATEGAAAMRAREAALRAEIGDAARPPRRPPQLGP